MPIHLSPTAYLEKNALSSSGVWIVLLEIYIPQIDDYIRVSSNSEDTIWRGETFQAYYFEMDEIGDSSKGEVTQFAIKVGNIDSTVGHYVDEADGATGSIVKLFIVNSNIVSDDPEIELEFFCKSTEVGEKLVTFTLGVMNPYTIVIGQRMLRTGCRFNGIDGSKNGFKGPRCKYSGDQIVCNRTFSRCKELANTPNFGGFPGIGVGNTFYV